MADMTGVGHAVSAPKKQAMAEHDEVFDNRVSIRKADDGTFLISAAYKKVPRKPSKDGGCYPCYCPDKEFTAPSLGEAFEKARALFG